MFKGGWLWSSTSFENLTQATILFYTQDVICCVRDTEASSAYIIPTTHPYMQTYVNSINREIKQRILIVSKYL